MGYRKLINWLKNMLRTGAPILIWGPPGVGKSATVEALGREMGLPVVDVIPSAVGPTYFHGLPVLTEKGVRRVPPDWAKELARAGRGILFLDHVNTAPPEEQVRLIRGVLDRVVGDLKLPEGVHIIAAANPPELAVGGWGLAPSLANRFNHIHFELDPREWAENFPTYWGNPPRVIDLKEETWSRARALVAAFIWARPELLLQVPQKGHPSLAWPSPRTWDFASRVLGQWDLNVEEAIADIQAAVGEGPGLEFYSWAKNQDLPDPEELLKDPAKATFPAREDLVFATLSGVVAAVATKPTPERWEAGWEVLAQAAGEYPDIALATARPLAEVLKKGEPPLSLPKALPRLAQVVGPLLEAAGR